MRPSKYPSLTLLTTPDKLCNAAAPMHSLRHMRASPHLLQKLHLFHPVHRLSLQIHIFIPNEILQRGTATIQPVPNCCQSVLQGENHHLACQQCTGTCPRADGGPLRDTWHHIRKNSTRFATTKWGGRMGKPHHLQHGPCNADRRRSARFLLAVCRPHSHPHKTKSAACIAATTHYPPRLVVQTSADPNSPPPLRHPLKGELPQ